jgi:hypothetical protein
MSAQCSPLEAWRVMQRTFKQKSILLFRDNRATELQALDLEDSQFVALLNIVRILAWLKKT